MEYASSNEEAFEVIDALAERHARELLLTGFHSFKSLELEMLNKLNFKIDRIPKCYDIVIFFAALMINDIVI